MSVVINGDTGISGVNGSAGNPAIKGGDADTGIHFGTDTAAITTGGTDKLSIDSSGDATFSGTVKTSKVENANTSNGGVEIDTDGHVAIDGANFPTAGSLSNRNLIINGSMQVAQRGTSNSGQNSYAVDRFNLQSSSTDTTISQVDVASGTDPYNLGFRKHVRITNTSTTGASNGYRILRQRIEAQNIATSGWQFTSTSSYITLSFWVKASVSQEYYGLVRTENATRHVYAFSLGTIGTTWTKVTKTIPGAAAITINNDNGAGLNVDLYPWLAGDFTNNNPLETWAAEDASNFLPDMANTWASTIGATFDVTGVQLEVGSKSTPFEHESFGQTLLKCQRYYYEHPEQRYRPALIDGNGVYVGAFVSHPVQMRAKPSISLKSFALFYYNPGSGQNNILPNGVASNVVYSGDSLTGIANLVGNSNFGIGLDQQTGQWECRWTFSAEV